MRHLTAILLYTFFASPAFAQITLTEQDFLFHSDTPPQSYSSTDTNGVRLLENLNGANATWDFTGRTYVPDSVGALPDFLPYPSGAALANDPDFTTSTHVARMAQDDGTVLYSFYRIDATGIWTLGATLDSLGNLMKLFSYTPPLQQFALPVTYGTSWQSTSVMNLPYSVPGMIHTVSIDASVDGYGTLILPPAQNAPTLRIAELITNTDSLAMGGYHYSVKTKTRSFFWTTNAGNSASVNSDSAKRPLGVSYTVQGPPSIVTAPAMSVDDLLTVRLSQNPVGCSITTAYYNQKASGMVDAAILDNLGRAVQWLHHGTEGPGEYSLLIDPASLTPGTYFLRIQAMGTSAMQKLIVQ